MRRFLIAAMFLFVLVATSQPACGTITTDYGPFTVTFYNNGDTDGTNTSTQNWSSEQMTDVGTAIAKWDSQIIDTPGRQINLHMFWDNLAGNSVGSAYSPSNGDGTQSWTYTEHIWRDGVDYDGPWDGFDGYMVYDETAAGYGWNFGSDLPSLFQVDFRSVVTHEIGHAMGFYDTHYAGGYDDWGNVWGTPANPTGYAGFGGLSQWDQNLLDQNGNAPLVGGTGTPGNFDEQGTVLWIGSHALQYNGGDVEIYAPSPYSSGSSLSHLDEAQFGNAVMSPQIALGQAARQLTPLEWEMMKDMGWNIVPEANTLPLLAIGWFMFVSTRRK